MRPRSAGVAMALGAAVFASVPAIAAESPGTADSPGTAAADTTVNIEAALRAAQIDPQRDGQKPTPGAKASVKAIEKALRAEGLLAKKYVDGHFGTQTVTAYTDYQKSLGFEGIAANGLPATQSLKKLGADRFTVSHSVRPGDRTKHTGEVVNERTEKMLVEAQRRLDRKLALDQGSYNPDGDPTSAGTHDGGGVVDINVDDMDKPAATKVVKMLRKIGFAAWYRTPSQGDWPYHIHAVALSDPDLSPEAQEQAGDYYLGKNGLANEKPDDGPRVKPIRTWEQYQRATR